MLGSDESNAEILTGFAAAEGMLLVPAGNCLIAFQSTPTPPRLLLDTSGPLNDQIAALDSVLFLRDPFPVVNEANLFNAAADRNTRVLLPVSNLQLLPGEPAASVIVNLIGSNNQSYDIPAEDVRPIPNLASTQVIFRLPNNLATGVCTVTVSAHGQINPGRMTIR